MPILPRSGRDGLVDLEEAGTKDMSFVEKTRHRARRLVHYFAYHGHSLRRD